MAPMFLISNPKMVISACEAGIIGSFPALNGMKKIQSVAEITNELLEQYRNAHKKIVNNYKEPANLK
ncbi:hypothetical protein ACFOUV_09390 [Oceanobacillus longus]|uniref:Uncharacterized protein n=1 Tax=Oceanobacillus longus TaxID=930120 RepID=A0ABV8GWQ3_9BACI